MPFKTKIDGSDNRQFKQDERTELILPGVTRFGLPQGELSTGPDLRTVRVLIPSMQNITSTFTGNTSTGEYTYSWGVAAMAEGEYLINHFDLDSQEGDEQFIGPVWVGKDPIQVNGETIFTRYEGYQYDLTLADPVTDNGDGTISGSTRSNYEVLEADALDYGGDYIWVDVRGNIQTDNIFIKQIGIGPSIVDLGADAEGKVVNVASDSRLKENIEPIRSALEKVLGLKGVTYNWKDRNAGGDATRIGFVAQDVKEVVPELVYDLPNSDYLGVYYNNAVPLIIEAIKELVNDKDIQHNTQTHTTEMNVELINSEDNIIELNYGGNHESSKYGGIVINKGVSDEENSELRINSHGDWQFTPGIFIDEFTPISSEDPIGNVGNITRDDDFLYIKTKAGWKRTGLENF